MLRRIPEPLALSEASLLALRPALNAPVLNVDFLPVGPARAAIVIFAEEYGGIGLAFGIRSIEGGQVAVFRNREPMDETAPLQEVLEPALASAERMGFLFDEDMVDGVPGDQGRSQATALWGRLMGDVAMPPPPRAAPPLPAATEPILDLTEQIQAKPTEIAVPELVLEEVAPPTPAAVPRPAVAKARLEAKAPMPEDQVETQPDLDLDLDEAAPSPLLSKFRPTQPNAQQNDRATKVVLADDDSRTESRRLVREAAEAPDLATDASPLGRVPLVRVRVGGDGGKRIPFLARLLSSF